MQKDINYGVTFSNRYAEDLGLDWRETYLAILDDPELFHIEKPGLKGAFHLNCVGCHQEMEGPTGCEECHTMSETGEKRFNTGRYTPSTR